MRLRDLVLHNLGLKLASLLVATGLWVVIYATQTNLRFWGGESSTQEKARWFPKHSITVMKSAADIQGSVVTPDAVDVLVSGDPTVLARLADRDLQVYVDLTSAVQASEQVKNVAVFAPPGVKVVEVRPSLVRITRPPVAP